MPLLLIAKPLIAQLCTFSKYVGATAPVVLLPLFKNPSTSLAASDGATDNEVATASVAISSLYLRAAPYGFSGKLKVG